MAKKRSKSKEAPGIALEKVVVRIQQMMDLASTVTHNEQLADRTGNVRQYDVVIRGRFAGRDVLGVMECKDHNRKKGPDAIDAFAKKTENLGANFKIMVSRLGFTKQALRAAKHEHIGCVSVISNSVESTGFPIGEYWYGIRAKWGETYLTTHSWQQVELPQRPDIYSIKYQGKSVIRWFIRHLFTTHRDEIRNGVAKLHALFKEPTPLEIDGVEYPVHSLTCCVKHTYEKKRKWVSFHGDGFYDWHDGSVTVPPTGTITSMGVDWDLSTWQAFDGEIPDKPMPTQFASAVIYDGHMWSSEQDALVPDLNVDLTFDWL